MRSSRRWRWQVAVAATAVALGAGLMIAANPAAQAAPGQAGRIQGGVEDGTFSGTCLSGTTTTPPTQVLDATAYRGKFGDGLVRILVPYDIALQPSSASYQCLHNYLVAAQGKAQVEVSLNRTGTTGEDPAVATYTSAVNALAKSDGPLISFVTAWNEPNNTAYLKTAHPASKSGHFYLLANKAFPGKVVAGDFASGVGAGFLNGYVKALGTTRPKIWAIHPYTDVTNFQFYLSKQPANAKNPAAAGQSAVANSKIRQFAMLLGRHNYGSGTQLWINEIYIDHVADKCSPTSAKGTCEGKANCKSTPQRTCTGTPAVFLPTNQGDAALFLSGALGANSLPGVLKGTNLPQLTRYVYLRARADGTDQQPADADALQVHFPSCVYYTLAGSKQTPAPQCS